MNWLIRLLGGVPKAEHDAKVREAVARAKNPLGDGEVAIVLGWMDEHLAIHQAWIDSPLNETDPAYISGGTDDHHRKYADRYRRMKAVLIAAQQEIARLRGVSP